MNSREPSGDAPAVVHVLTFDGDQEDLVMKALHDAGLGRRCPPVVYRLHSTPEVGRLDERDRGYLTVLGLGPDHCDPDLPKGVVFREFADLLDADIWVGLDVEARRASREPDAAL